MAKNIEVRPIFGIREELVCPGNVTRRFTVARRTVLPREHLRLGSSDSRHPTNDYVTIKSNDK